MQPKKIQEVIDSIESFDILDNSIVNNTQIGKCDDSFSWSALLLLIDDMNNEKVKMTYIKSLSLTSTQKILTSIYEKFDSLATTDNSVFNLVKYQNSKNPRSALILTYYYMLSLKNYETYIWFKNIKSCSRKDEFVIFTRDNFSKKVIGRVSENVESRLSGSKRSNLQCIINKEEFGISLTYKIDEYDLKLKFRMPDNYPLGKFEVTIESDLEFINNRPCLYVCKKQLRYDSRRDLENQIVDIVESFEMYISKIFNDFEDCSICCSILTGEKHLLPLKSCPVCNKRFHSVCLVSWFKGSIGRSCPLCRSNFNFK